MKPPPPPFGDKLLTPAAKPNGVDAAAFTCSPNGLLEPLNWLAPNLLALGAWLPLFKLRLLKFLFRLLAKAEDELPKLIRPDDKLGLALEMLVALELFPPLIEPNEKLPKPKLLLLLLALVALGVLGKLLFAEPIGFKPPLGCAELSAG